jgi:hypothetical protein
VSKDRTRYPGSSATSLTSNARAYRRPSLVPPPAISALSTLRARGGAGGVAGVVYRLGAGRPAGWLVTGLWARFRPSFLVCRPPVFPSGISAAASTSLSYPPLVPLFTPLPPPHIIHHRQVPPSRSCSRKIIDRPRPHSLPPLALAPRSLPPRSRASLYAA